MAYNLTDATDGFLLRKKYLLMDLRRSMAEGFAALNAGKLTGAQARFLKARALRPEAPDVAEALAQTEIRLHAERIESTRQRALAAEQREDWAGALAAYEESLGLESTLQFAQQGKDRAAGLVALERRIAFFLNQPGLLDSDAQLENAARLLQEVQAAPPVGSRLRTEADKLGALVQAAKTPVRVAIASDSLTEVSVYRIGRLGRFGERELSLRPSTRPRIPRITRAGPSRRRRFWFECLTDPARVSWSGISRILLLRGDSSSGRVRRSSSGRARCAALRDRKLRDARRSRCRPRPVVRRRREAVG